jgi:hypothetical protein
LSTRHINFPALCLHIISNQHLISMCTSYFAVGEWEQLLCARNFCLCHFHPLAAASLCRKRAVANKTRGRFKRNACNQTSGQERQFLTVLQIGSRSRLLQLRRKCIVPYVWTISGFPNKMTNFLDVLFVALCFTSLGARIVCAGANATQIKRYSKKFSVNQPYRVHLALA